MGRLQEYLTRRFGFPWTSYEHQNVLGAAVALQICTNHPDRLQVIIMNMGVNNVYIGFTSAVAITNGLLLAANGGMLQFTAPDDGDLPSRQLWAIAAAGAPTIYVIEGGALL